MYIPLFGTLLIFFSWFALPSYASAQQCTTSVLVNAFDAESKASLRGLRASDFAASAGRDELNVESVRPVFRNRVLVLLDLSGQPDRKARAAMLQNATQYVNEAPPGMPVSFGAFATHAVFTSSFYGDPESLASSLQAIMPRAALLTGRADLASALREALAVFGRPRPGDTVLLISNGDVHLSRAKWNSLERAFASHQVRLQLLMNSPAASVSALTSDSDPIFSAFTAADRINPGLVRLANRTGGVLMGFMNSEWFNAAASGYVLQIRESQTFRSKNWRLRVRNYDEEFSVQPVLFYPRQLPACSASLLASADIR